MKYETIFEIATKKINALCKIYFGELYLEEIPSDKVLPQLPHEINTGNTIISVSSCGHIFHTECISDLANEDECHIVDKQAILLNFFKEY